MQLSVITIYMDADAIETQGPPMIFSASDINLLRSGETSFICDTSNGTLKNEYECPEEGNMLWAVWQWDTNNNDNPRVIVHHILNDECLGEEQLYKQFENILANEFNCHDPEIINVILEEGYFDYNGSTIYYSDIRWLGSQ